ncbi:MAG: hypothetical protein SCARUB_04371 [Candidatus Scalindua rubra]|uniref:Uncharacterized protein n=1 Tax=Candidatus Scalindua rubra TaxID=1872076 RepID=A0A1E3X4H7_9BACT|nr:MAG: hypothetical protein SCARUB_04371 [Candidatus Scalindua rubra]
MARKAKIKEPASAGVARNNHEASDNITIRGSAPAGGCTVLVNCIPAIAVATASPITHQEEPSVVKKIKPTNVDRKCPPIMFLGCANGLSGTPNASTQDAPNEGMIKGLSINTERYAITAIPNNPPNQDHIICLKAGRGGHFALPRIFEK